MDTTRIRRSLPFLAIVLVCAVGWPAGLLPPGHAPEAEAAFPGDNGRIAFSSNRVTPGSPEGDAEIYTMKPDGSDLQQVTANNALDFAPAWSPDGKKLVFVSNRGGNRQIFTMRADGTQQTNVSTSLVEDIEPTWSPDGAKIAFVRSGGSHPAIYTMNANGGNQTPLTDGLSNSDTPAWSPNGSKIAFASNRDNAWGIFTMNANGTNPIRLTNSGSLLDYDPDWSPDGTQIIFGHNDGTQFDIYRVQATGANPTNLTNSPLTTEVDPAWSPDGSQVVFIRMFQEEGSFTGEILTMHADGSHETRLTTDPSDDLWPTWQRLPHVPPDVTGPPKFARGGVIVFSSNRSTPDGPGGDAEIYTLTLNPLTGDVLTQLTSNTVADNMPAWSPDGARIAFEREGEIYVMNADGSNQVNTTNNPASDNAPAWSPDGARIIFSRNLGSANSDLFTMNANGTNQVNVTNTPDKPETEPDWSPDGARIVFVCSTAGSTCIGAINADGSNPAILVDLPLNEYSPQWSPDGQQIVFASSSVEDSTLRTDIFTAGADGSNPVNRTRSHNQGETAPAWSPDGRQIVYSVREINTANIEIFTMKVNGTSRTNRTNNPTIDDWPDWSAGPSQSAAPHASGAHDGNRAPGKGEHGKKKHKANKHGHKHGAHGKHRHGNRARAKGARDVERNGRHERRSRHPGAQRSSR